MYINYLFYYIYIYIYVAAIVNLGFHQLAEDLSTVLNPNALRAIAGDIQKAQGYTVVQVSLEDVFKQESELFNVDGLSGQRFLQLLKVDSYI